MTFRVPLICVSAVLFATATASAQQRDDAPPQPVADVAPPVPPPPRTTVAPPESDHAQFVHHLGVGYLGTSILPIAIPPAGSGVPPTGGTVTAPNIGARYWFSRRFGIDGGVGVGFNSGSQKVSGAHLDTPSTFGLDVHAGLPIALVSASHYVFEIVPETTIGFTSGTIPGTPASMLGPAVAKQSVSGFLLDVGVRVGTEVHFGFIGVPQLALQASVAVYYSHQSFSWSQSGTNASVQSDSLGTSVQASPWAIFTDSVSALYDF